MVRLPARPTLRTNAYALSLCRAMPFRSRGALFSRGELAFFFALRRAVGRRYFIATKVRLADLVTCPDADWRQHGHAIAQKHVDFVLCHRRTTRIIVAVELDDRSHDEPARIERDAFVDKALAASGIGLIRVPASATYSRWELRSRIKMALASLPDSLRPR